MLINFKIFHIFHISFFHIDNFGQICNANVNISQFLPVSVKFQFPPQSSIVFAAAGSFHTLFIDSMGMLYGCGRNSEGQLGLSNNMSIVPQVTQVSSVFTPIQIVSAGSFHSIAKNVDGKILVTGW